MENNKKNRRSAVRILVNREYQLKHAILLTVVGALLMTGIGSLIFHRVSENYSVLVDLSPMTDDARAELYSELHQMILQITCLSLGFLGLLFLIGMRFSHRTAGPLYRFDQIFKEIRDGDLGARVHLRPRDDFRDVADSFNEMMDKLESKIPKS